jgi:outer membrane protein TolC
MPLGNAGPRGRLRAAEAEHRALERRYRQAVRQVEREVREIEIRLRESLSRIATLSAGVGRAREKREIARVRFERGVANSFDITDADRDLVSAESELLDALVDHATQLALLEARIARPL